MKLTSVNAFSLQSCASLLCALMALSCEAKKETAPSDVPEQTAGERPREEAEKKKERPWFSGLWRGEAKLSEELSVEDQDATVRGEKRSGQELGPPVAFEMELTISEDGVSGMAKQGEHQAEVRGVLLEEALRVNLRGNVLQGNWNGKRSGANEQAKFSGFARVSTTMTTEGRQRVRRYSGSVELIQPEEKQ